MTQDFFSTLNTVKQVLAADFACQESDFDKEGVQIFWAKELPGRRRFPFREKTFIAATMGPGVVVSCAAGRLDWVKANLGKLTRDVFFESPTVAIINAYVEPDGQFIVGPDLKHLAAPETFIPFTPDKDIAITLLDDAAELAQYNDTRFPNCVGHPNNPMRVAAVARCKGKIAGMAAAGADCDVMWQIGVDTFPEYRNRGIGKATVGAVAAYILNQGIVPYYSTLLANVASRKIAAALGFKPAWVELYVREISTQGG